MTIPRILHRIWLDDEMPDEFAYYGHRWRELNPGWNFMEWRDTADLPLLHNQTLFEFAERIIPRDWKRFRSDLLRLELLWQIGGVYVDTDVEPLKPLPDDLLEHEAFAAWSANKAPVPVGDGRIMSGPITQAVLGARAHNAFIGHCIRGLPEAVRRHRTRPLAQMIGPWHITRTWARHPEHVTILPARVFYPQSNLDRDAGETPLITNETLTWHRWANTRDRRHGGV